MSAEGIKKHQLQAVCVQPTGVTTVLQMSIRYYVLYKPKFNKNTLIHLDYKQTSPKDGA